MRSEKGRRTMENTIKRLAALVTALMTSAAAVPCGAFSAAAEENSGIAPVEINEENFPDDNFRAVISGSDYDRDGNGILDAEEIGLTINIHCENCGIKSLKGVEFFKDLQGLWCMENEIESVDLSENKDLRGLWCSDNKFTSLDMTPNPELTWVYCYDCEITELNVANNPKLLYIECNTNPITELDVSNNHELVQLTCGNCELTELDVTHNPELAHLDAFGNHLTELDVTQNPKMKRLDIWDNEGLGSIDISKNTGLQYYNCANNDAKSVDVSHNPQLNKLICSYNELTELDVSNCPKLVYLDCAVNDIPKLDLTNNTRLHFLQAFTNSFTELDIGSAPFLIKTYNEGEKKDESAVCVGHSWTIDYHLDDSTSGDSLYFLCFDDAVTLKTEPHAAVPAVPDDDDDIADTENLITREQAAQTLYEMAGSPDVSGQSSRFTDTQSGEWYENAVTWGEQNNICVGYPEISSDSFGVGRYITRQDLVMMLMRYSEVMGYKRAIDFGRSDDYLDYYDIDYDHWEAICWSATWNIMEGKGEEGAPRSEQMIDPLGKATRDDFISMLTRLMEENGVDAQISIAEIPEKPAEQPAQDDVSDDAQPTDEEQESSVPAEDTADEVPTDTEETVTDKPDDGGEESSSSADEESSDEVTKPENDSDDGFLRGDVNFDGQITVTDISMAAAHIKGIKLLSDKGRQAAEVSGDGMLNVTDLSLIAGHIKGIRQLV